METALHLIICSWIIKDNYNETLYNYAKLYLRLFIGFSLKDTNSHVSNYTAMATSAEIRDFHFWYSDKN